MLKVFSNNMMQKALADPNNQFNTVQHTCMCKTQYYFINVTCTLIAWTDSN